jgi:hypothetical protein
MKGICSSPRKRQTEERRTNDNFRNFHFVGQDLFRLRLRLPNPSRDLESCEWTDSKRSDERFPERLEVDR